MFQFNYSMNYNYREGDCVEFNCPGNESIDIVIT